MWKETKIKESLSMEADLENAYFTIKRLLPKPNLIDSLNVVKTVEEYRQFWKPKTVKVILLAESHVFTTQDEYNLKLNEYWIQKLLGSESMDYPRNFVRFVYCLGYGEKRLLIVKKDLVEIILELLNFGRYLVLLLLKTRTS